MTPEILAGAGEPLAGGLRAGVAEIAGSSRPGNGAFGDRREGTAEAGAVTGREDGLRAGPAIGITHRRQLAARLVEIVPAIEQPQKLVGRLEAIAERHRFRRRRGCSHPLRQ